MLLGTTKWQHISGHMGHLGKSGQNLYVLNYLDTWEGMDLKSNKMIVINKINKNPVFLH